MDCEPHEPLWVIRLFWYIVGWSLCWVAYIGGPRLRSWWKGRKCPP